jgi:hypothetical protein
MRPVPSPAAKRHDDCVVKQFFRRREDVYALNTGKAISTVK